MLMLSLSQEIVTGNNLIAIRHLLIAINWLFAMKGLDHLHLFLGIEVHRSAIIMHLSQAKYNGDILK